MAEFDFHFHCGYLDLDCHRFRGYNGFGSYAVFWIPLRKLHNFQYAFPINRTLLLWICRCGLLCLVYWFHINIAMKWTNMDFFSSSMLNLQKQIRMVYTHSPNNRVCNNLKRETASQYRIGTNDISLVINSQRNDLFSHIFKIGWKLTVFINTHNPISRDISTAIRNFQRIVWVKFS